MTKHDDIHELFEQVRSHPDYAGGTIWTREDVAEALFVPEESWGEVRPSEAEVAQVSQEAAARAASVLHDWIFEAIYSWREAIRDFAKVAPAER